MENVKNELMAQLQEQMNADAYRLLELVDEAYKGRSASGFISRHAVVNELLDIDVSNLGIAMGSEQPLDINRVTDAIWRLHVLGFITEQGQTVHYNGLANYLNNVGTLWEITLVVKYHPEVLKATVEMFSAAAV